MHDIVAATLRSLAFLSRLPPSGRAFSGALHRLGDDAHAFPLAGLVIALPSAMLIVVANLLDLTPFVAAVLAIALMVALTGALHEDGLGDLADGLGGHHPRERALAIMKDSRIGTYGALALILSIALRIALVADLVGQGALAAPLSLLAAAAASRGAMGWLWSSLASADPGGLADRVGRPSPRQGRLSLGIGGALLLVAGSLAAGPIATVIAALLGLLALGRFRAFIQRRLGGQTGDCLGACQQIVEIAVLLGLSMGV